MPNQQGEEGSSGGAQVLGQLREFKLHVSDWNIYKARLNNYFLANTIENDDRKRAVLLNMLDEDAYRLVFNLCMPIVPELKSFDDIKEVMDGYFTPQTSIFAERIKFYESRKEKNEAVKDWATRVRSLAITCDFGDYLEVATRDKFITGFERGAVLDRLLEEKLTVTFLKAVEIAESKMAAQDSFNIQIKKEEVYTVRGTGTGGKRARHGTNGERHHQRQSSDGAEEYQQRRRQNFTKNNRGGAVRFKVCGYEGHVKDKCNYRNYFCKICNKKGHLARVCRQRIGRTNFVNDETADDIVLYNVNTFKSVAPYFLNLIIMGKPFNFQIDTGSSLSLISEELYKQQFPNVPLCDNKVKSWFKSFNG
ncbi:uncharacterized protein [Onthophagus taurus]|uniref:uncharacterized protein n=1 Tax=Onthophagus taurus TaxID=166361 RepID=UPI0039BDBF56